MHATVPGNFAQGIGRDVTGQDNGRDVVLELLPQACDDFEPVDAVRQVVVGDDQVRDGRPLHHQLQRLAPIGGHQSVMTVVVEKQLKQLTYRWIVFDDQDCTAGRQPLLCRVLDLQREESHLGSPQRHLDGEARSRPHTRADLYAVDEQIGKALRNSETQAHPLASFARGIVELMEFFEDRIELKFWNTGTGVPDLDAELVTPAAAAKEEFALVGVFHRVRQQIANDLFEKTGIAAYGQAARDHAPVETIGRGVIRELGLQLVEQALD